MGEHKRESAEYDQRTTVPLILGLASIVLAGVARLIEGDYPTAFAWIGAASVLWAIYQMIRHTEWQVGCAVRAMKAVRQQVGAPDSDEQFFIVTETIVPVQSSAPIENPDLTKDPKDFP
jgi:hypothetical protein